jgi:mono/diheme cytochrome c family protein
MKSALLRIQLATAVIALLALPTAAVAADAAAGKMKYDMFCATCHGATGKGDGPGAPPDPKPRDLSVGDFKFDTDGDGEAGTDADLKNVIRNGAAKYDGSPLMIAWPAGAVPDSDVANIIAYIRSLKQ